jgi:hypothetical protein
MRSGIKPGTLVASMLLAATFSLSDYATAIAKSSNPTPVTLQTVQFDLDQAELQREATVDALNELSISPEQDIPQAYATFSTSVERMEMVGARLIADADGMYFNGPAYFIESEQSTVACEMPRQRYKNARRDDLGTYFDAISEGSWDVKHAYRSYQFDLRQLRDFLANNQNPKGIETMVLMFRKAQLDSASFEDALERALAAMDRAKTAKAQAAPKVE